MEAQRSGTGAGDFDGIKTNPPHLNRLGSSLSYSEVKSLETEFAFSAEANDLNSSDGLEMNPSLGTGLAWDNCDVDMENLDGKDTLHATVEVCYQNISPMKSTRADNDGPTITGTHRGRKRRQFNGEERYITPCYKQVKKAKFDLSGSASCDEHQHDQEGEGVGTALRVIDFHWLLMSEVENHYRSSQDSTHSSY